MAVYVWGFGKSGQLGNGQTDTQHTPVRPKLPQNTEIADLHCGGYYTAVVSQNGQLYTFGCGKHGRLGSGSEEDRTEPIKISVTDENGKVSFQKVSVIFQTPNVFIIKILRKKMHALSFISLLNFNYYKIHI